jgi:hypothetical protein
MGAQNIIGLGFDIDTLTAQKKQVLEEVIDLFEKLEKYDGTKLNPLGPGGLNDLRKSIKDGATAMGEYQAATGKYIQTVNEQVAQQKQLAVSYSTASASIKENAVLLAGLKDQLKVNSDAQKQLKKDQDASILSLDQYNDKVGDLIKEQFALKQSIADTTKEIVNQSRAEFVTPHSKDDAIAQNKILTKQVSATDVNDVERIAQLNALIDRNNQLIDENSDKLAKQKINIGNYAGSFGSALEILKEQLAAVKDQLGQVDKAGSGVQNFGARTIVQGFGANQHQNQGPTALAGGAGAGFVAPGASPEVQQLTNKAQLLENTIERLSVGFKTSRQESRAFQEAAVQLGLAVGQESKEFIVFNEAIGHAQNGINDIKAATKFQASDAKLITGLANAAQTLAGGFGAATAAASLFAGEDDNLQKQMAKFQELLVLINGLQAVANGLQAESGGIQLLLSARTSLLNAAKGVQLLLTTRAIQAVTTETGATALNAEAKEIATVATGEQTVAEELQTVAVAENTEATAANTVAQTAAKGAGVGTIAIAAGIAAVAIGAGVALALLTAKLFGYKGAAGLTTDQQKELAKATGDLNDALNAQAKVLDDLDASQKRYYTNLIQDAQDAGASQYALLLLQERYDQQQKDAAKAEVDRLGATDAAYSKQAQQVQQLLGLQTLASEEVKKISAIPEKDQTSAQKKALEADLKLLDVYSAQLGPAQKSLDTMGAARQKLAETTQKAASDETRFNKLSLDEQLDVAEKAEELRANLVKARNAIILSSDASTLGQRIAAIKSNTKQENDILDAQITKVKSNPSNFLNGLLTPEAQQQVDAANEKRKENLLKQLEDEQKIRRSYYERDRNASLSATKTQLEDQVKAAQELQQGKGNNPDPLTIRPKVALSDRLTGLSEEYAARRDILNAELKVELDKEGQTAEEKKAIYKKYGSDIAQILKDFQATYLDLEKEAQEESNRQFQLASTQRKIDIDANESDELRALDELHSRKLISERKYIRERQKAEDDAALARAQQAVLDAEVEKNSTKAGTQARADAEEKLVGATKNLRSQVKKNGDDDDAARLKKTQDTLSDIQTAYNNTTGAIGDILAIGYNTQKANLEKLEAQQEKAYESDVARINGSTLTEQEKSNQLIILDKNRQAQKEINDRKARQADIEKARFDKAASIANIGLSTAEAIVKFLADPGGFAGVALSISAGVIGAAQIAAAVATPLPKYRFGAGIPGRPDHPGGYAVVGDGGEKELIKEPGKQAYWSPAVPTTLDLRPHTQVLPLSRLSDMISQGMFVNREGVLMPQQIDNTAELKEIKSAIGWLGSVVKESARANRVRIPRQGSIANDLAHAAFIRKNVLD